jgi:hypothetical protein
MYEGRTILAQLLDHLPQRTFRRIIQRYRGDHRVRRLRCWDQYVIMAFAQLTYRESLRDIEACLEAVTDKLYHSGIRSGPIARSTLADANERRDWRIFAEFAQVLVAEARRLYSDEPWALELEQTVYALDASIIDLCLSVFPWARFRSRKAGIKLHALLDLCGNIPTFVWVTDAKTADSRILDLLLPEPGAIYILDRGYSDYKRLYELHQARATFVTRARKNLNFKRRISQPIDRASGVLCDQAIVLGTWHGAGRYQEPLRRIRYRDPVSNKAFTFLTSNFDLSPVTIAQLYQQRWQVELFFKWIKQHLRIKAFYGTTLNAVRTQIWIAISVYVLVAIVRKRLKLQRDLYPLLQILSITLFDKIPLQQALTGSGTAVENPESRNQLQLFDF